jgi:hypothetical protein
LKEELAAPLRVMQEFARRIAKVSKESKLTIDENEYVSSFKVELMDAVIQWCRGSSFADILKVRLALSLKQYTDPDYLYTADGPVRGKHHPRFPSIRRTHSSNGSSSQGHWKSRAQREIRKSIRNAGETELRYFLLFALSVARFIFAYYCSVLRYLLPWHSPS